MKKPKDTRGTLRRMLRYLGRWRWVIAGVLLLSLVSNLQVITPALSLTQGGPGTGSYFMCFMLYTQAFKSHKYGYGSAIAVVLFALIAVFTGILFSTSKSWIFYEGDDKE